MQPAARLPPNLAPGAQVRAEVCQILELVREQRAARLRRCLLHKEQGQLVYSFMLRGVSVNVRDGNNAQAGVSRVNCKLACAGSSSP